MTNLEIHGMDKIACQAELMQQSIEHSQSLVICTYIIVIIDIFKDKAEIESKLLQFLGFQNLESGHISLAILRYN